jgi:hypothetical protein
MERRLATGKASTRVRSGELGFFNSKFIISYYHDKADLLPWVVFLEKPIIVYETPITVGCENMNIVKFLRIKVV